MQQMCRSTLQIVELMLTPLFEAGRASHLRLPVENLQDVHTPYAQNRSEIRIRSSIGFATDDFETILLWRPPSRHQRD